MLRRSMSLICLFALAGCPDEDVIIDPPAPTLEAGPYDLVIHEVTASSCGALPEVRGQVLPAELSIEGRQARLDLAGLVLAGELGPDGLFVEASPGPVVVEGEDPPPAEEPVASDDGDTPVSSEDRGGDCVEPAAEGEDGSEPGDPGAGDDCGGEDPPPAELVYVAIDAEVIDAHLAEGGMVLVQGGCEIELSVSLGPPRAVPVPVTETEDAPGAVEGGDAE